MSATEQRDKAQKGAENLTKEEVDRKVHDEARRSLKRSSELNTSSYDLVTHLQTLVKMSIDDAREWWQNRR